MKEVKEDHIRDFANSPEWNHVMKPLLENQIELSESKMEDAVMPHDTHAAKEVWTMLRRLIASIEIYNKE